MPFRRETELNTYTITSFISEFGSYLGLLLGWSILEIGTITMTNLSNIRKLVRGKRRGDAWSIVAWKIVIEVANLEY